MKLLSTIAFYYNEQRLEYLSRVVSGHLQIDKDADIFIATNTTNDKELSRISAICNRPINIVIFINLVNPWHLTWGHKQIIRDRINDGYTHYIYSEDDIELLPHNFDYWTTWRKKLRPHGLYPSFVRVEYSNFLRKWVSTDLWESASISMSPKLNLDSGLGEFINLKNPYQGMFLYDHELMLEHLASPKSDVSSIRLYPNLPGSGGIGEAASFGLTFDNAPSPFFSRNVVKYFPKYQMLDPTSFVHHLGDRYANDPAQRFGKVALNEILSC